MQLDVQVIPKATLAIKVALRIFGIVKKKKQPDAIATILNHCQFQKLIELSHQDPNCGIKNINLLITKLKVSC